MDDLFNFIIVALETLDVFGEALLCLIDRLFLILDELAALGLELYRRLPLREVPSLFYPVAAGDRAVRELAEGADSGL